MALSALFMNESAACLSRVFVTSSPRFHLPDRPQATGTPSRRSVSRTLHPGASVSGGTPACGSPACAGLHLGTSALTCSTTAAASRGRCRSRVRTADLPHSRRLSGKRTYISTTNRITSGDELMYRNGLAGLRGRGIPPPYSALLTSWCTWFDRTRTCISATRRIISGDDRSSVKD